MLCYARDSRLGVHFPSLSWCADALPRQGDRQSDPSSSHVIGYVRRVTSLTGHRPSAGRDLGKQAHAWLSSNAPDSLIRLAGKRRISTVGICYAPLSRGGRLLVHLVVARACDGHKPPHMAYFTIIAKLKSTLKGEPSCPGNYLERLHQGLSRLETGKVQATRKELNPCNV